jgi:hypothetical protein
VDFVKLSGFMEQMEGNFLEWRAVDQDGHVLDILLSFA